MDCSKDVLGFTVGHLVSNSYDCSKIQEFEPYTPYSIVQNKHGPLNKRSLWKDLSKRVNVAPESVQTYVVKGVFSKPSGKLIVAPIFCF